MTAVQDPRATELPETATTTLATRVRDWAAREPDGVAMREKHLGVWEEMSWAEYWDAVHTVGHALIALGVEPGDRVAVHAENRREWLISDVAIVAIRAMTVGLYPTNPAPEVHYLLGHSGSTVLIAEDQEQVDKALAVADDLPDLHTIVYLEPRGVRRYDDPRLLSWEQLLSRGRAHREEHPDAVAARMRSATPDDVATLIYTSGTTGPPKGAMLSVRNVEFAIATLIERGGFVDPPPTRSDLVLSYLPLCHVVERVFSVWFNAAAGVQVNFAESIDTVQQNLAEVQPTIVFGVPRIWEKVVAGVEIRATKATPVKRLAYRAGMALARRIGATLVAREGNHTLGTRVQYALGWALLFRPLRDRIGLRKARYAVSGAAPIAPEVLEFFMGIGVPMHEAYGMTENSAIATANRPGRVKLGTVGEPHAGIEVAVDERTGEICTRHPGNFVGYWRDPEATREMLDGQGWLHTGDVGEWVDGTHIRITDRMKDIVITAGGKNLSPSEIENALKASPYVKEAVIIGDGRKYLTALIGIELETVGDWAQRHRIPYTTYRDLTEKPEVVALIQSIVDETNARLAQVEQVKRFRLLPKELDHEDGELTATQKVKRSAIAHQFSDLVEEMYGGKGAAA